MRFAEYPAYGPPEVLRVVAAPTPEPGPGQVLIEIRAAGVNPFDVKQRAGLGASAPLEAPRRTGYDGAGVVVALGPEVEDRAVGDAVVTRAVLGTAGTHLVAKAGGLLAIPDGVGFDRAAAVGTPAGTAYQSLRSLGVGPGDVVLIHGGSGAVGQAAIQLARAFGAARVIATAGAANLGRLAELGAEAVDYGLGVLDRILERLGDARPTVVLDAAGTDAAFASADLLADRRRWATIVAGARADELGLTAYSGGSRVALSREQNALRREGVADALQRIAAGGLDVELGPAFPLDEIVAAHRAVEERRVRGKVVVRP